MIDARRAIEEMSDAVCRYLCESKTPSNALMNDLQLLAVSVIARLHIAEHNAALLSRTSLEQLSRFENPLLNPSGAVVLLSDADWDITIKSRTAGTLARLMAFSETVSACVNAGDTLGRYVRVAYGIQVAERQASLTRVRQELVSGSPLFSVLDSDPGLCWMENLRNLRGECQHGKIAATILTTLGTNAEPLVPGEYCDTASLLPMSEYIDRAMGKTAELVVKTARVITTDPRHAVQLKK